MIYWYFAYGKLSLSASEYYSMLAIAMINIYINLNDLNTLLVLIYPPIHITQQLYYKKYAIKVNYVCYLCAHRFLVEIDLEWSKSLVNTWMEVITFWMNFVCSGYWSQWFPLITSIFLLWIIAPFTQSGWNPLLFHLSTALHLPSHLRYTTWLCSLTYTYSLTMKWC